MSDPSHAASTAPIASTGVVNSLAMEGTFQRQAQALSRWIAGQDGDAVARGMREAAYFWLVRVSGLWGDDDLSDPALAEELADLYVHKEQYAALLEAVQEMMIGDERADAVVADAVCRAILTATDISQLSEPELRRFLSC